MPFGCQYVVLNTWPYCQICLGCKFSRDVIEAENQDDFHGCGTICMRSKEADYCVRNNHEMTEEQQYAQMESEDKIAEEQAIKEMNEHNLAQATTTEQLEIAQKLNEMNNSHLEGH